jgi:hypothetical protein
MTVKQSRLFPAVLSLFVIFYPGKVEAQFEHHALGARPVALGGTGMLLRNDPWAGFVNPAMYTSLYGITASVTHIPARFNLSELRSSAATIIYPMTIGTVAAAIHRYGFELYSETTAAVSGARDVGDRITLGITLNWYHLSIERYGNAATLGTNIGIHADITESLTAGFMIANINRPSIGRNPHPLPRIFRAGFIYRPLVLLQLAVEVEKDILFDTEFRFGAEYILSESFYVRAGMNDHPPRVSGGFSINHGRIKLDYALQWHFELGQTHFVTLVFTIPERREIKRTDSAVTIPSVTFRPSLSLEQIMLRSGKILGLQDQSIASLIHFINTAEEDQLTELPGIGRVMAHRIKSFIHEFGPIRTLQDFKRIRGIGERTIENIIKYWLEHRHSDQM